MPLLGLKIFLFPEGSSGLVFFVGGMDPDMNPADAPPHRTPDFYINEEGMKKGVRALAYLTIDYMLMEREEI